MIRTRLRNRNGKSVATSPSIPFSYDANTYWWNFINPSNDTETTGTTTVSYVVEKIAASKNLMQHIKALQPLYTVDGINGYSSCGRGLLMESPKNLVRNKGGFYFATILKLDAVAGNPMLMMTSNAASVSPSRFLFELDSGRKPRLKAGNAESTTLTTVGITVNALPLSTWSLLEIRWTRSPNTLEIWVNGVLQTLASGPTGTFDANTPDTDPMFMSMFGNGRENANTSVDGAVQQAIYYDGVPTNTIRDSISTYLMSVKP